MLCSKPRHLKFKRISMCDALAANIIPAGLTSLLFDISVCTNRRARVRQFNTISGVYNSSCEKLIRVRNHIEVENAETQSKSPPIICVGLIIRVDHFVCRIVRLPGNYWARRDKSKVRDKRTYVKFWINVINTQHMRCSCGDKRE